MNRSDFDVVIVGGGLAGLTAAILLARAKKKVLLIEKKIYPFHKVCGEYVSNEILAFLKSLSFDPFKYGAQSISKLRISTQGGRNIYSDIGLGGFGLSRYIMDEAFYQLALKNNVEILTGTKVTDIVFNENIFTVKTSNDLTYTSKIVIGSYGKRDSLDKKLNRKFIQSRTGYLAVKYHVKTEYPIDEIGLDNFENGYCGIVKIEGNKYNLCYLYKKNGRFKNIEELQQNILFKNPVLKNIFSNSEFLFPAQVINEISFQQKELVENHILMCGDSAGLIAPVCGNGMSIAIHCAKLLSELILQTKILEKQSISIQDRSELENFYKKIWNKNFKNRLSTGRTIQKLFGNRLITGIALRSIHFIPPLKKQLIASTHGQPILVAN